MTPAEILAELRGAPCHPYAAVIHWYHYRSNLVQRFIGVVIAGEEPDAISEAIEYLERQEAIAGCRYLNSHKQAHGVYASGLHTNNPTCGACPAELHGTEWI